MKKFNSKAVTLSQEVSAQVADNNENTLAAQTADEATANKDEETLHPAQTVEHGSTDEGEEPENECQEHEEDSSKSEEEWDGIYDDEWYRDELRGRDHDLARFDDYCYLTDEEMTKVANKAELPLAPTKCGLHCDTDEENYVHQLSLYMGPVLEARQKEYPQIELPGDLGGRHLYTGEYAFCSGLYEDHNYLGVEGILWNLYFGCHFEFNPLIVYVDCIGSPVRTLKFAEDVKLISQYEFMDTRFDDSVVLNLSYNAMGEYAYALGDALRGRMITPEDRFRLIVKLLEEMSVSPRVDSDRPVLVIINGMERLMHNMDDARERYAFLADTASLCLAMNVAMLFVLPKAEGHEWVKGLDVIDERDRKPEVMYLTEKS